MSNINYNTRTWLNPSNSHFTGSITCFDGTELINQGKQLERYTFVEIASCHSKIRIHNDMNLSPQDFIEKLRLMHTELSKFIQHLEGDATSDTANELIEALHNKIQILAENYSDLHILYDNLKLSNQQLAEENEKLIDTLEKIHDLCSETP